MKKLNILGINLSVISKAEVLKTVAAFLNGPEQHFITTPNPEIILAAGKHEELFYILNQADLSVLDGFGLKIAAWLSGQQLERYPGADLIKDVLSLAEQQAKRVLILNWRGGLSSSAEIRLSFKKLYPNLDLLVMDIDRAGQLIDFKKIDEFAPAIMLVSLGAPFQEKIVFQNLKKISSLRLAIGIGGALDFLTGKAKRAPKIFRTVGLEWLWRMLQQSKIPGKKVFFIKRIKRVFTAVFIFTYKYFAWRCILPFVYRKNVVCLLYKSEANGLKILIVERSEGSNHWQLPQGGTDGQKLIEAGARELREELNCDNFKVVDSFPTLWKYKFKDVPKKIGYETAKHWGYKGQTQGLVVAEFCGDDSCIGLNYWDHQNWRWVDSDKLVEEVYPSRRASTEIFLKKFDQAIKNHEI